MAVNLNIHDLTFVLQQIKIAEAHANGAPLADLVGDPRLPYGLRTVDGTYNNLVEGRETWGAADQVLPRLFDPNWRNEQDGDSFDPDGPFGPAPAVTNTDYGSALSVADVDPRLISNLIVDQSPNNPAAIASALSLAGYGGSQALAIAAIRTEWQAFQDGTITRAEFESGVANYGITMEGDSLLLPNVAPDEGLSAPFNAWMTFFGQFFDHGLDLISKGGAGTVYVPLQPDDPLYEEGGFTNFMVLTRATQTAGPGEDGIMGTADDTRDTTNVTTPFVDQNQTYTSHPSHQVFLREYEMVDGRPVATGHLLEGVNGGLATWADVKAQARDMLGIVLTDKDVGNIPLVRVDAYGKFIPDENGFAQVITGLGADGVPNTEDDIVVSGTPENPVHLLLGVPGETVPEGLTATPLRTNHAFLDDIAHNAVPVIAGGNLVQDADSLTGNAVASFQGRNTEYDNELLDRHFITGDGRGNENVGLTAVHHVFHSEHNRQVESTKLTILKSGDADFINEWLTVDVSQAEVDTLAAMTPAQLAVYAENASWDGERMFQAARFATEMQYQHLVFEEFGRKIQPNIDPFVFNTTTDIDPAIFAEFAHVVYRFGHSMLTEDVGRMFLDEAGNPVSYDANGVPVPVTDLETWGNDIGLIEAFLNPVEFDRDGTISHEQAAGAIFRGMNITHGNHIDEFVTDALRSNLLGLPLDLAAINIARGRDTGMPSLNEAREQLYDASGSSFLTPYASWAEFGANLKTPMSVINFIAAYGTHESIIDAGDNIAARRDAATALVLGTAGETPEQRAERIAWLNGPAAETGVNDIDLWIGGLAEKQMPFGGFLGSTFNAVFEMQMEILQDNDRFYYLTRTQGLNLLNELENNAFAKLVMANTDMTRPGPDGIRGTSDDILDYHTGVDSFALHDHVLHVDPTKQIGPDPQHDDGVLNGLGQTKVQRDDLATPGVDQNYIKVLGGEHVAINGTDGNDTIIADFGDDAIWGGGGDDRIEGGAGVDLIIGGAGNDIITDSGDTGDFIKGEDGDDVIANSNGLDILMGGKGQDVFIVGVDLTEVFAGEGNDFILGGDDADFLMGNEGDDWIEGGGGFDVIAGDNSELFFNSTIIGHDVMFAGDEENDFDAESGDDIMVQGESVMRNEGMLGFDWASHQGSKIAADSDMTIKIFETDAKDILRNRFDQTEALSGSNHDDILRGDDRGSLDVIGPDGNMVGHELTQAGVDRIAGLREALGLPPRGDAPDDEVVFTGGNILMGGAGSDLLEGRGGDDIIDGDARLNVRISVTDPSGENEIATVTSLSQLVTLGGVTKPLSSMLLSGEVKPAQLNIVREIVNDGLSGDQDTAVFYDLMENYQFAEAPGGGFIVTHVNPTDDVIDPFTGARRVSDGSDTVRNVEWLQFADQRVSTADINTTATGAAIIDDTTPTEGQLLTVDVSSISDTNGIASFSIQWQQSANGTDWVDIPGAVGAQFTPEDLPGTALGAQAGQLLRASFNYVDGLGFAKSLLSAPTGVTGVNWQADAATAFNGTTGDDILNGSAFADVLIGNFGNDNLIGGDGNDILFGDAGADITSGGLGNDIHVVQDLSDVVLEAVGEGNGDWVYSSGDYILNDGAEIEFLSARDHLELSPLALSGNEFSQHVYGNNGDNVLSGRGGDDTILGFVGDDTIVQTGATDGHDKIDGGGGIDTWVLNAAAGESYTIYTRAEALAAGMTGISGFTEIVVTLNGSDNASIIAELDNIEEIVIDSVNVASGGGVNGGNTASGATIAVIGNFDSTSLDYSTITINGGTGDETIDIQGLTSAHRVVFNGEGGNDRLIGDARPQDSIPFAGAQLSGPIDAARRSQLAAGIGLTFLNEMQYTPADSIVEQLSMQGDVETLARAARIAENASLLPEPAQNIVLNGSTAALEAIGEAKAASAASNHDHGALQSARHSADDGRGHDRSGVKDDKMVEFGHKVTGFSTSGDDLIVGTAGDDYLVGGSGDDVIHGGAGDDMLRGGSGDDVLYGGSGDDVLEGGSGNDVLDGGSGDDTLTGGSGADIFVFGSDDSVQDFAVGEDLLDISALGVDEAGFADAVQITQQGADTAVTIGSSTMILRNVDAAEIDVTSFHLAGSPDAAATSAASTMELQFGTLAMLDEEDEGDSFAAMFFANDTVALPHAATPMDSGNPADLGVLMSGSRFNGTMSDPLDQVTHGFADQFVMTGLPPETSLHDILKAYHDNQEEPPLGAVNSDNFLF